MHPDGTDSHELEMSSGMRFLGEGEKRTYDVIIQMPSNSEAFSARSKHSQRGLPKDMSCSKVQRRVQPRKGASPPGGSLLNVGKWTHPMSSSCT